MIFAFVLLFGRESRISIPSKILIDVIRSTKYDVIMDMTFINIGGNYIGMKMLSYIYEHYAGVVTIEEPGFFVSFL